MASGRSFRRGERHDTLRDLVPSLVKRALGRSTSAELGEQEFWALKGVSFEVKPGEALGIIGPNGAGKSTTLKVLTRILKPTKGRCVVRGRVGALIEIAAGFHPDLTGRENVFLQGTIMGMRHPEILKHFDAIVEFAGLSEFIDTPVKRYSSGMNARLGFSIAAHLEPDVLLIDEVPGGWSTSRSSRNATSGWRRSNRAAFPSCLVSHNMQAIASLCTSALLLRPHEDPLLDDVTTVAGAYSRGQAPSFDPRLRLTSVRLCRRHRRSDGARR
jgi:lipopolysaccharide transport system ATP-binding protein